MSNTNDRTIDRQGDIVTVRELIASLSDLPPDAEIVIVTDETPEGQSTILYPEAVRLGKHLCAIIA
jgi:hypothetical protein